MTATDLIIQWFVAAIVGLLLFARGRLTLFHPTTIYLLFHSVAFCLRPTLIVAFDLEATWKILHLTPEPGQLRQALWVSSAGLVACVVVFLLGTARATALRPAAPVNMDRNDKRALLATAALVAVPGLASTGWASSVTAYSGYASDLQWMFVPVALLTILALQWRWWSLLPFIAVTAMKAASGDSATTTVLAALVLLLLLWLWSHQRYLPSISLLFAGGIAAIGTLLLADHRSTITDWIAGREVPGVSDGSETTLIDRLERPALAHFEALTFIVSAVPDQTGTFSHGSQHLEAWMEKTPATAGPARLAHGPSGPVDLSRSVHVRGVPDSLVADGWTSGGWTGVVITLAIASLLLGVAYVYFSRHQDDPVAATLFATVQGLGLELYQTGDSTIIRSVLFAAAPLWIWRYLANRFRRAGVAEADRERRREERQRRRLLGTALLNPNAAPRPPGVLSPAEVSELPEREAAAADSSSAGQPARPSTPAGPEPAERRTARWRSPDDPHSPGV